MQGWAANATGERMPGLVRRPDRNRSADEQNAEGGYDLGQIHSPAQMHRAMTVLSIEYPWKATA